MSREDHRTGQQVKGLVRGSDHSKGQCMLERGKALGEGWGREDAEKRVGSGEKGQQGHPSFHFLPRIPDSPVAITRQG